jgi:hypothetical protein
MTKLAEGKPVSAKFAAYFKNPVEEVANDVINEQKKKQRRLDCERIWNDSYWKFWTVLSWIAFRDINQLCEDRDGFKGLTRYAQASQKERYPERLLLAALKNGKLKAIRDGKKVRVLYWADKDEVDRDVRFIRIDVRRCWPGQGEALAGQPENASYAQAQNACNRREALKQYKARLKQGVEIRAELEKVHSDQGSEVPPGAPGPIAEALDLWSSWDAADLADLSKEEAARHAALKNALTPDLVTALLDLEAGKTSTLAAARLFQSVLPHVLDVLPDVPLIQKVRTLVSMLNARDKRNEDDPLLTIGQTLLWRLTGARELMDLASNDSRRLGASTAQVVAAELFDALNLPHERIQDEAHELRRRCLAGRLIAKDYDGREIATDAWIQMEIVLKGKMPSVQRIGQSRPAITVYDDIFFKRDEVLQEFSPEVQIGLSDPELAARAEELDLRRQLRTRQTNEFKRKQARIALGKRRWLSLTVIADEYAKKRGSLEIDDKRREEALEALRCSILTEEFMGGRGSRVLNMNSSPLENFRFDPLGASNREQFDPIAADIFITYQDCIDWFKGQGVELPRRLQREPSSTAMIAVGEAVNEAVSLYAAAVAQPSATSGQDIAEPHSGDDGARAQPGDEASAGASIDSAFGAWSGAPIVSQGWDIQQIYQHLTQKCGLKPDAAINELNLRAPGVLWCVRFGDTLLLSPPRNLMIRDCATFRLGKDNTVEIVMNPALSGKPMVFRAFPDDVLAMWPVARPHAMPNTDAMKSPSVRRKKRAGRRDVHDWDEATLFLRQIWEERGDPDLLENRVKDWRSDSDIWEAVVGHLRQTNKNQEPPDVSTVRKKLSPEVGRLRGANRQN